MFALKKLITPFLLPPGIFILGLIVSGAYLFFTRKRKAGLVNIVLGFVFWATCTVPFADLLMEPLESRYPIPEKVSGDVIVLLGGGIIDSVPDLSGNGVPKNEMLARIVTAVRLQRMLALPVIVSGGRIDEKSTPEAIIVQRFLVDLGVNESRIILDDKSRDTRENAAFTKVLCGTHAFKHPILLTSAYHMPRSVASFEKAGLNVLPFPTNFYAFGHGEYHFLSYLPTLEGLSKTSSAIHESLGLLFYRLTL